MSAGGTARTPDPRLADLARTSRNFGFLHDHLPLLVAYGAAAEAHVLTDPNTSLLKSRQFGEALVSRPVEEPAHDLAVITGDEATLRRLGAGSPSENPLNGGERS
ncbi:hypothetical protein GCM10022384_70430 [Streptomyces marokkonensis]|uniref:Uncharacterized protein n=1 Tax=Streptomyces marokkonensis TaxID=324855 RepID=A0ABP7SYC1_9ACTN